MARRAPATSADSSPGVPRREIVAWAMFDFANSGYTTVVLTALFNVWFVHGIASELGEAHATILWTLTLAAANLAVFVSAPLIGALADLHGHRKRYLALATFACILFTVLLGTVEEGEIVAAALLVGLATSCFATGENLIAAFLPEITTPANIGRISGYGWALGYLGGLLTLGLCLLAIRFMEAHGAGPAEYVPVSLWITAALFGIAALPSLLWLHEPGASPAHSTARDVSGYRRLRETLRHARQYRDLFRFLWTLIAYQAGVYTVVVLAGILSVTLYGFTPLETLKLLIVVNATAAAGAWVFGHAQDRYGARAALAASLLLWIVALTVIAFMPGRDAFWVAANLIGIALGACQSAGRAIVGLFTPSGRNAEYFGLWGFATKAAAVLGPLLYGLTTWLFADAPRLAVLSTLTLFVIGIALLTTVDMARGQAAARGFDPAPLKPGSCGIT